ncbi:MAG: hypothetical protein GXP62_21365, partial [Oligoflexia bacterium]|nr:hypothetical protein [Oligoflexia bacterium]
MRWRVGLVASGLGLASLGCGLLGSDSPPPEPEHYPIVVPSSVVGVWWAASSPGGRTLIAWPCPGQEGTELLHLDLPQGGPVT